MMVNFRPGPNLYTISTFQLSFPFIPFHSVLKIDLPDLSSMSRSWNTKELESPHIRRGGAGNARKNNLFCPLYHKLRKKSSVFPQKQPIFVRFAHKIARKPYIFEVKELEKHQKQTKKVENKSQTLDFFHFIGRNQTEKKFGAYSEPVF